MKRYYSNTKYMKKILILFITLFVMFTGYNQLFYNTSYAHGATYSISTEGNKIKISLKWDEVNSKKLNISYYYFADAKTLCIGYEERDGVGKSSIEIEGTEYVLPIKVLLTKVGQGNYMPFSDIADDVNKNNIWHLHDLGVLNGVGGSRFGPNEKLTRASIATMIVTALGYESEINQKDIDSKNMFSDISGHWGKKYIIIAAEHGLVSGNGDGTFKPNNYVTVAELSVMLTKAFGFKHNIRGIYDKLSTGKWYSAYVQNIFNAEIIRTTDPIYRNFNEMSYLTRSQCAMMMSRALSTN